MKTYIKTSTSVLIAALALAACPVARADILTVTNDTNISSWDNVGGNAPFYETTASITSLTGQGFPAGAAGASYTVLSEYFTITNLAGGMSAAAASSNYMLNAISVIAAGGAGPVQIHLFDVTTNLSASSGTVYNGQAKYNFVANGDLLGASGGLTYTNNIGERQVVIVLQNGPNTQDQVILSTNHTYALEFWVPKLQTGNMTWYRNSNADPGGQGMGSTDGGLTVSRITLNAIGDAGGTPRTFMMALYGTPTMAAASANSSTNIGPLAFYTYDDFSTNGVGPENPTNDDWLAATNIYLNGAITNVYVNWFGGGFGSVGWSNYDANGNPLDAQGNPASGVMILNMNPANGQWVLHRNNYPNNPLVNSLVYTGVEMDVRFDVSSFSAVSGGTTNYGPLRLGVRANGAFGQDWFYYLPAITTTNWTHVVAPLSATDPNQQNWGELLIGMDPGIGMWNAGGAGPQTIYVDNIKFIGSAVPPPIPPPTLSIQSTIPGLRLYAGSPVNTYDRSDLVTVDQNQSFVGATPGNPVTYSFSLLSYPNNNINQTMVEVIPVGSLNGNATYGQEFGDYQALNGVWLVLGPNGAGRVTATVEWKTNGATAGSNPNQIAMVFTNPTALGTWQWQFTGPTNGTVTSPSGISMAFSITDGTAATDFGNPAIAQFGLQPNSAAGEGLFETWGFIGVTNVIDGNEYEDFTSETSDLSKNEVTGYNTTPGGSFNTANSANQASQIMAIIIRENGVDPFVVSWTTPVGNFTNLVTSTNMLLAPATHWVVPTYYSSGNDNTAPRGNPELEGSKMIEVIPTDNSPTVNGQPGGPLAPNAFFLLSSNTPSSTP